MDYTGLVKRISVPDDWTAPTVLHYDDIRIEALRREHVEDDVRGINASIELIRRTRGGAWPSEPVTVEYNYVDLVWHECEFRDNGSFTYAIYGPVGYLGCAYLYPVGSRKPLTDELIAHDVDVSWWVIPDGYERGYYAKVYAALRHWLDTEFPFTNPYFSNAELPG